jgi:hypothetical protein
VLVAIGYFGPKLFRAVKVNAYLIWKKIVSPPADQLETELPKTLPHELDIAFHSVNLEGDKIAWAVPCISAAARNIPGNLFGYLIATERPAPKIAFVAKRRWNHVAEEIELDTYKLAHEPKFISENIVLYSLEKKPKFIFLFTRSQRAVVKALAAELQTRLAAPGVARADALAQPVA